MLNEDNYRKILIEKKLNNEECALAYRIFFQFLLDEKLNELKSNKEFLDKVCDYFTTNNDGKVGDLILNSVKLMDFSSENVYKINKMISGNLNKFTPAYFSKICSATGLFIFLLKDAIEYSSISIIEKKTPIQKIYNSYNYNLDIIHSKQYRLETYLKRYIK
jgi:hypothetical protein